MVKLTVPEDVSNWCDTSPIDKAKVIVWLEELQKANIPQEQWVQCLKERSVSVLKCGRSLLEQKNAASI